MSGIRVSVLSCVCAAVIYSLFAFMGTAHAQGDPRANVNIVGMTPDPADIPDNRYRQQNEPACAIRPDDSACIICAYNDYRAVDDIGDAWEGVSQSCDAGDSWLSRLAPGHPGDTDAELVPAEFAADPRLAAIPGMTIFNFIAGYRDSNVGVLAIQHWLEVNKEDADHYEPGRVTYFADTGTSGKFLDKPDMVAVLDKPNRQSTISLTTEMENTELGSITRDYPSGKLYVAYAAFTGSQSVKVLVKSSDDWGVTWPNQALKLSEDQNQVSGISLTAVGQDVLAVWRRRGDNNDPDSIMYSMITNDGKKATKGEVLADLCPFDQPTLDGTENLPGSPLIAFRTNDFPWTANDGNNFFVFYSDRGRNADGSCDLSGRPRIVMHQASASGTDWNPEPIPLEPPSEVPGDSFQFMPTAFGANGKVQVAWYDTRREAFGGALTPWPFVADYNVANAAYIQRTVDVYTTSVSVENGSLNIPAPIRVSQYSILVDEEGENKYEIEASFANKKLFAQGTAPFLGDYIAMAARQFRKTADGESWESNASAIPGGGFEDFFTAWADNRDVRGEILDITQPLEYGYASTDADGDSQGIEDSNLRFANGEVPRTGPPRDTTFSAEGIEGGDATPGVCGPGVERSRDSNIYGSLIKDEVRLFAATPSKPLSGLQRAFPLSLSNATDSDQEYTLEIANQPCASCQASFRQQSLRLDDVLIVPAFSSAARTVFISVEGAPSNVTPVQVRAILDGDVVATVELGNNPTFSDPENCPNGDASCTVVSNELHNLALQQLNPETAALLNAALLNAALLNPSVKAADLLNANLLNAALLNADLLNANLLNPTLVALAEEGAASNVEYCAAKPSSSLCDASDGSDFADIVDYAVANPEQINAALLNAALLNAALLNANLLNADLLNANLLNANLLNANLLNADLLNANLLNADLLNANLLNANLLNANLLNADLLNANLLNANLLNANLLNATLQDNPDATVTYDDYTYPITNNGNVTTAIDADITLNAPMVMVDGVETQDILGTKLITWTVNATPTSVDCVDRVQLDPRIQSIVPNPDTMLEEATITSPFEGEVSTIAAAGETVFVTLRVVGTPEQLKNVRISGFTAASQAANCTVQDGCETELRQENEKILFKDDVPPQLTLNGANPLTVEAILEDYAEPGATAIDNIDGDISSSVVISGNVNDDVLGTYLVDYSVADSSGNVAATLTRTVLVVDTTPPGAPTVADITVEASSPAGAIVSWSYTAVDAVNGTIAADCSATSGATFPLGQTVVSCTASDPAGTSASSSFTITVEDTTVPAAPLVTNLSAEATSPAGAIVSWSFFGADIVNGQVPADCSSASGLSSGSTFPLGVTSVSCTASDTAGTSAASVFSVTVQDTTVPSAPLVSDITVEAIDPAGAVASWSYFATDIVNGQILANCSSPSGLSSGSIFPLGATSVSCSATDSAGTGPVSTFTVTVTDTTSPVIDPVELPDDLDPNSPYPFELEADADTITVSWPISVNDADPGVTISCSIDGVELALDDAPVVVGGVVTATFSYEFPVGSTTVMCTATDANNPPTELQFTIDVEDVTAPTISVPAEAVEIGLPVILPDGSESFEFDYSGLVSVADAVDSDPTLECRSDPADAFGTSFVDIFSYGDTLIECRAEDASNNAATAEFVITAVYPYEVRLQQPKGRPRLGSTVPLDWQYFDINTGALLNSASFEVGISWVATDDCKTPNDSGMSGEDSGSSDFRYSASSKTWQYSWQTKDLTQGKFLVAVTPPGPTVDSATACVNLR